MTEVQFHVNVRDRLQYTCRLLRKAVRLGARVVVTGPQAALAELDRALWVFEADEFLPHAVVGEAASLSSAQRRAPVWLVAQADRGVDRPVLINLGADVASGFEAYQRLIEIVSSDDEGRDAGRRRWREYQARGYSPAKHEATA
ncbi:MAG: DNA polymerase III subunit chi [Burkholderiaceae bacterium]|nr:DNA polymerase III subunit chi [Burkholderiaceae bacterium]